MIERDIARTGLETLSVVIADILETAHDDAVTRLPGSAARVDAHLARLQQAGADIAALAGAMVILARRSTQKSS